VLNPGLARGQIAFASSVNWTVPDLVDSVSFPRFSGHLG
jgi:hypothetical protein